MKFLSLAVLFLAAALAPDLRAQRPVEDATVDELVSRLTPPPSLSRSARNIVPQPRAPSIDLVVNFDFDSARLQSRSLPLLEKLAEAMKAERLAPLRFLVEGHTDAKGGARYNEELSLRRARSVAAYLVSRGVDGNRLEAAGKGFAEPLDGTNPHAPENRRVRIAPNP